MNGKAARIARKSAKEASQETADAAIAYITPFMDEHARKIHATHEVVMQLGDRLAGVKSELQSTTVTAAKHEGIFRRTLKGRLRWLLFGH